jgi:outer membrane protein assembly factor BamC
VIVHARPVLCPLRRPGQWITPRKKQDGWLSKLAFWKGSEPPASSKVQYRIHVSDAGQQSVVQILSNEGGTDKSETSKKILALLLQQLQ